MSNNEVVLTKLERYFLSNQLRILEALYPDEANSLSVRRESIENGYEMLYTWDMDFIYDGDDKMTRAECSEVWNTMDMFDAISRAVTSHGVEAVENNHFAKFRGYDGNNESKFMAFAAFTVERLQRFTYLPGAEQGNWNSHIPTRDTYKRMFEEWQKIPEQHRFDLTKEQLNTVVNAAIHPENQRAK